MEDLQLPSLRDRGPLLLVQPGDVAVVVAQVAEATACACLAMPRGGQGICKLVPKKSNFSEWAPGIFTSFGTWIHSTLSKRRVGVHPVCSFGGNTPTFRRPCGRRAAGRAPDGPSCQRLAARPPCHKPPGFEAAPEPPLPSLLGWLWRSRGAPARRRGPRLRLG